MLPNLFDLLSQAILRVTDRTFYWQIGNTDQKLSPDTTHLPRSYPVGTQRRINIEKTVVYFFIFIAGTKL